MNGTLVPLAAATATGDSSALIGAIAVVALLVAGAALLRSVVAMAALAATVIAAMFAGVQALLVVGAAAAAIVALVFNGPADSSGAADTSTPSVASFLLNSGTDD